MRRLTTLALAFVSLIASGCAARAPAAAPSTEPSNTLLLHMPGSMQHMTIEGDRMFGPQIEVARYGTEYRGRAFGRIVDLRSSERLIEGSVGSARTELHLENYPDGFMLRGLYGGQLGAIEVRSDRVAGSVGAQAYDLRSACGDTRFTSGYGPTELLVPASVMALPAPDRAAILAIFLGR
jgi:hypothetical protein